jgi:uncharacterized protein YyaL (SSP411 family)
VSARSAAPRNRLAGESSPYLLLHAGNPVDWYPWGEEAFAAARRDDKPIFLSVGYSTCYWCHVMERESFSDAGIAEQLNRGFVSIKLDREERPDLDEVYMTATQLLTRSGGWPNSLFLTHDLKPFYAGTYFPPDDRFGRPGFPRVLVAIREAWESRLDTVLEQAEAVAAAIREQLDAGTAGAGPLPGSDAIHDARDALARRFDATWGGFGAAPKFPSPSNLFLLLDLAREGDAEAREMLVTTLERMARGGIHDQLAGGFHRYSVDAYWLVPHFEKMLYDNAALLSLYAEAHAAGLAPGARLDRVARACAAFVLAELTGEHGAFLSAIDAETDGHEGAYYVWSREELEASLGAEDFALLSRVYGFDGRPNFEDSHYVLHLPEALPERARMSGVTEDELLRRLEPGRQKLLAARGRRPRPLVDDKVLADWNGLMIAGMARAGRRLGEPGWVEVAARAARLVLDRLRAADGVLLHAWREGSAARVPALLDDYAFLVDGLLALEDATGDATWRRDALALQREQDERLGDPRGGWFVAGEDEHLLHRAKAAHDGAVASGNGVAALNLLALAERTGDATFRERAAAALRTFAPAMGEWPLAHVTLLRALRGFGPAESPAPRPARALEREALELVEVRASLGAREGAWRSFTLELVIRPGWHVQAHPASAPELVATEVREERGRIRALRYPAGRPFAAAFAGETLDVYAGVVRIEGEVEASPAEPCVRLIYQACDEDRCLPPVARRVTLA